MALRVGWFALVSWMALVGGVRAQEGLERPSWIEKPDYVLVYPERFDATEVDNMLVELPNRPLRAGETRPRGPAMMFPSRRTNAAPAKSKGPDQLLLTPFGPVSSRLQRPPQSATAKAKSHPSRRQPLGW